MDVDAYDRWAASAVNGDFGVAHVEHDERRSMEHIRARGQGVFRDNVS